MRSFKMRVVAQYNLLHGLGWAILAVMALLPNVVLSGPYYTTCRGLTSTLGISGLLNPNDTTRLQNGDKIDFSVKWFSPVRILWTTANHQSIDLLIGDGHFTLSRDGEILTKVENPASGAEKKFLFHFWMQYFHGNFCLGFQSEDTPLLTYRIQDQPKLVYFKGIAYWIVNCLPKSKSSMGCRDVIRTANYNFERYQFSAIEEWEMDSNGNVFFRFMVRRVIGAFIRITSNNTNYYEVNLNWLGQNYVQKGKSAILPRNGPRTFSSDHFNMITVKLSDSAVSVYQGDEDDERALIVEARDDLIKQYIYPITNVSFASVGDVLWAHKCQGLKRAIDLIRAEEQHSLEDELDRMYINLNISNTTELRPECRVINTYKYKFDQYFALSLEGTVSGTYTELPFWVMAPKDIHLQFVSDLPPNDFLTYEVDIDFYNRSNVDRGKEAKVATAIKVVLRAGVFNGFLFKHNSMTGLLEITTMEGNTVIRYLDKNPFPIKYFSVSSGSSAGKNIQWMFGCAKKPFTREEKARISLGCSRPMFTHKYSHSQYLTIKREGTVKGNVSEFLVYVSAKSSAHIRLEPDLPPEVDAKYEIDISHPEGKNSIYSLGKLVASNWQTVPIAESNLQGFWVRHDYANRLLEFGNEGEQSPILSWKAPDSAAFPRVNFMSLTTSRVGGPGKWIYGCKNISYQHESGPQTVPPVVEEENEQEVVGEEEVSNSGDVFQGTTTSKLRQHLAGKGPPLSPVASQLLITKIYMSDIFGLLTVKGHLYLAWHSRQLEWDPLLFDNFEYVEYFKNFSHLWVPDVLLPNGDADVSARVRIDNLGSVLWKSSINLEANCYMSHQTWPADRHQCRLELGLWSAQKVPSLLLLPNSLQIHPKAALPFWNLLKSDLTVQTSTHVFLDSDLRPSNNSLVLTLDLSRNMPIDHHLLHAPFITIVAMLVIAYWIPEPLPGDKLMLGSLALILHSVDFILVEAGCPFGLDGVPKTIQAYSVSLVILALVISTVAILSAKARYGNVSCPPSFVCSILTSTPILWLLKGVNLEFHEPMQTQEIDVVGYTPGSSQLYMRHSMAESVLELHKSTYQHRVPLARQYWILLSCLCERLATLICFTMLMVVMYTLT